MSSPTPPDPMHIPAASKVGSESPPNGRGMRFGLFGGAQARRGDGDPARDLRDYVETCVEAEALGFDSSFLVEHHFSGSGQLSASLDLLAWVAARTTTLRIGTAVIVLPWHDPVLLAERAATLDLMSGGRLEFGVGKGYRHSEFAGFRMPYQEAQERFEEALQVIVKAWTSDVRFSHNGRFWQYEDIIVEPPAWQKPHPPVWIAASKPDSIRSVAARGYKLMLDQFASAENRWRAAHVIQSRVRGPRPHVRSYGRRGCTQSLRCPRRCRYANGAGAVSAGARSHDRSIAAPGRAQSIAHHGLCRHTWRD